MRVRKSATRMAYIRENGWDDLSEGGDGTLISILVTSPLDPVSTLNLKLSLLDKQASRSRLLLSTCVSLRARRA
jgi:hypothetical protein